MNIHYCISCGSRLEQRIIDEEERSACPKCEFVHWGSYSIGVGALILRDNKILLVRRARQPGKGLWTNPGGYIEQEEPIEETVVREVMEETGVSARISSIVAVRDQPRAVHNLYLAFAMDYMEGDIVPDGVEVDAAGFFSQEELNSMPVAEFTKWLIELAFDRRDEGLVKDQSEYESLKQAGLFRRRS